MRLLTTPVLPLLMLVACGGETPPPPASPPVSASQTASATSATAPSASAPSAASAGPAGDAGAPATTSGPQPLTFQGVALPGVAPPASLDYIAYEQAHARVWVPVGNTGSVDVYDVAGGSFTRIDGFKTAEREVRGQKRMMGPSAVSIGNGVAYIGNRATNEVCTIDTATLKLGRCLKLPSATDGVSYVASAKEVWVTTPKDDTLTVLDASKPEALKIKTTIKLEGAPEGYAVDNARGLFFTNLEDKDRTVVLDVKSHKPKATWNPQCGSAGPRGIAADLEHGFLFVACTDHLVVLDSGHDGAVVAKLDTGAGVDNIDWVEPQRLLYIGAAKAAKLTVARMDEKGQPTVVQTSESTQGARNGVADASGHAYLADPVNARLLVFPSSH